MPSPTRKEIEAEIRAQAAIYNIDPEIAVRQCKVESNFDIYAFNSKSGCYGLFQLSTAAAKDVGVHRFDYHDNIRGGLAYLRKMLKRYDGDYAKALAAYNWGPTNLNRCIKVWAAFWRNHIPVETKGYLRRILPKPPKPARAVKRGGGKQ